MANDLIVISEYGSIEEHRDGFYSDSGQELPRKSFENLWEFSHADSTLFPDIDKIFNKTISRGRRRIQAKNYVGTIQTSDGTIIEILPKIYRSSGQEETDKKTCRHVFLKMLSALKSKNAATFQEAGLFTLTDFPILEVYISNYISEAELLFQEGLGRNYISSEGNKRYLKGKLILHEHIRKNSIDQSRFYIKYTGYEEKIPQNKIVVSTLYRLQKITTSTKNAARINMLLDLLAEIPPSSDILVDLKIAKNADRTMDRYKKIIGWSEAILLGEGFTTFSGKCINQALLFPAEKLFEDFVAKLFKDFFHRTTKDYEVHTQYAGYYLVDKQGNRGRFRLKPDIYIDAPQTERPFRTYQSIIIDTKWKSLNQEQPEKNYLIDIKDMYQLFAYGKKYSAHQQSEVHIPAIPKLVLIYPCSSKFHVPLEDYVFDHVEHSYGLRLQVEPFDLTSNYSGYMNQIAEILDRAYKEILLIGCYRNESHLAWIIHNHLYNVRINNQNSSRLGAIGISDIGLKPSKLLLYNINNLNEFRWYDLEKGNCKIVTKDEMKSRNYPFNILSKTSGDADRYILYKIIAEDSTIPKIFKPVDLVIRATGYNLLNGQTPRDINYSAGTPIYIDRYTELLD